MKAEAAVWRWSSCLTMVFACILELCGPLNGRADLAPVWTVYVGDGVSSCPCLGQDGTLYFNTFAWQSGGGVYALNPGTNTVKWTTTSNFALTNQVEGSMALAPDDSTLYLPCDDGYLRAIKTADGTLKWLFPPAGQAPLGAIRCSPSLGSGGTIYYATEFIDINSMHHWYVMALNPDGTEKWQWPTNLSSAPYGQVLARLGVAADGTIYVANQQQDTNLTCQVVALTDNGNSASQKWVFPSDSTLLGSIYSGVVVDQEGTIYFGTHYNSRVTETGNSTHLWALNQDGTFKWNFPGTGSSFDSSPAFTPDGQTLYVGCDNDGGTASVFALNPANGSQKWTFASPDATNAPTGNSSFESSPAVAADGTIYIGSSDARVYALADNGNSYTLKWQSTLSGTNAGICDQFGFCTHGFEAPPIISQSGNLLFIGCWDLNLYAFAQTNNGPANSFWPMYGENRRHSGNAQDNGWTEPLFPTAHIVDLGTFDNGSDYSYANAVNDVHTVTGNSQCVSSGTTYDYAFYYTPAAGMTDLGGFCTAKTSTGLGVNFKNVIVGYGYDCYNVERPFAWTIGNPLVQLSEPTGYGNAVAQNINYPAQIIGSVVANSGYWHAAFWTNSSTTMNDLQTLGGTTSYAYGLNNQGWVVGYSTTNSGSAVYHGFLTLSNTVLQATNDLGTMSGTFTDYSAAFGINGLGQITGFSGPNSGSGHAFLKAPFSGTSVGYHDLGVTVEYCTLNSRGQVVGYDGTSGGVWIYAPALGTSMKKLSNYLSSSDQLAWSLVTAMAISRDGYIVGWGYHNGLARAYLITPNSITAASGGGGCGTGGGGGAAPTQALP